MMLYKAFQNVTVSCLGMGNMRLPKIPDQGEKIDVQKARKIIEAAYEQGINYFDTAYRYHAGESELVVGDVLSQYPRDSFYLATKMPGHMMHYSKGNYSFTGLLAHAPERSPAELFEEQLEKCRVDYFDFYLLHNLCETAYDFYTNEEIGIVDYLLEQKKKGRIRHLGFSAHCLPETLEKFLAWRDCFEFVQIQLNYLDWTLQNAKKKYEILTGRNIPVWVMEPCRGGRLANFDEKTNALLKKMRTNDSIASWAFRWLQALPNVQVVLSGMNTIEQLQDNSKTFSENIPLTHEEREVLGNVVKTLASLVPCTVCRYCTEGCPQNLDIPRLIALFNEMSNDPTPSLGFTIAALKENEMPSNCTACGNCTRTCPQSIDIPDIMKKLAKLIAGWK